MYKESYREWAFLHNEPFLHWAEGSSVSLFMVNPRFARWSTRMKNRESLETPSRALLITITGTIRNRLA